MSTAVDIGAPSPPFPLARSEIDALVRHALDEDRASDDITTLATVAADSRCTGRAVTRSSGVVAGLPLALAAFRALDREVRVELVRRDGTRVGAGQELFSVTGSTRAILGAERVALNFLQRLSGIASLTAQFVDAVRGTRAQILDTRKTTPGLRALEKYAVRCGGGANHRADLGSAILIKDNHIAAGGADVAATVHRARESVPPGMIVEVECDTLAQVRSAVGAGADIILLDNMELSDLRGAVRLVDGRALTEASGGVRLDTVRAIADTGVDRISVGALTHSAPALDIGLDFVLT